MNADGSDPAAITPTGLAASWPAWSPDGSQIVFQVTKGTDRDLYLVGSSGSGGPADLTNDPAHDDFFPGWW